jgi:antitoxin HicB
MGKNYPMRIYTDESAKVIEWVAEYSDLPGCIGVGDTMEEALSEAEINKNLWIEAAEKMGGMVPEPSEIFSASYSGKFNIRLPKFLHKALVLKADEEDTSLNQLCLAYLSMGLAQDSRPSLPRTSYSVTSSSPQTVAEHKA